MTYPPNWPRCLCGQPVLDGHFTCGRVECDESRARLGLASRCIWCAVPLHGSFTQHLRECWLSVVKDWPAEPTHDDCVRAFKTALEKAFTVGLDRELMGPLMGRSPIETLRYALCACRTCGHVASSHIGGSCFECGREACWS